MMIIVINNKANVYPSITPYLSQISFSLLSCQITQTFAFSFAFHTKLYFSWELLPIFWKLWNVAWIQTCCCWVPQWVWLEVHILTYERMLKSNFLSCQFVYVSCLNLSQHPAGTSVTPVTVWITSTTSHSNRQALMQILPGTLHAIRYTLETAESAVSSESMYIFVKKLFHTRWTLESFLGREPKGRVSTQLRQEQNSIVRVFPSLQEAGGNTPLSADTTHFYSQHKTDCKKDQVLL